MVERSIATPASKRALRATSSHDTDVVLQSFAIEFNRLLPWLVYLVPIIHFSHFISFIKHRICTLSLCSLCLACIYCIIQGVQDMTVCLGHILIAQGNSFVPSPSLAKTVSSRSSLLVCRKAEYWGRECCLQLETFGQLFMTMCDARPKCKQPLVRE